MTDKPDLTIAYLTVNRPDGIRHCLDHVFETVDLDFECVVVDSTPERDAVGYEDWDVGVIRPGAVVGPAEAQQIAVDACQTHYLLLLADDVTPRTGAVEALYEWAVAGDADIATGVVVDPDGPRSIGRRYYSTDVHGRPVVGKQPVDGFDREGPVPVHEGEIIFAPVRALDETGFDPRFEFHLDMWDFFMSCLKAGVDVSAVPYAKFDHHDFEYIGPTMRESEDRWGAASLFYRKWGYWPSYVGTGDFGGPNSPETVNWLGRADLQ